MLNPTVEIAKSSVDSFELPCGYLDQDGNLHKEVEVREMTGEDEEVLAAKNMPVMKKLNKILARCTTAIGQFKDRSAIENIIPDLTQGDRVYLLFAIRRVSLGNEFPFTTKCPQCDATSNLNVDLSDLEIKHMPDPKIRTYDLTLPKTKKVARMKVLTGRGEEAISKASATGRDLITVAILARTESLDGKPCSVNDLKNLPMSDRNFLRDAWQDREGGVDTAVQIQCPQCDREYEGDVDMASQGFFNPLAAAKALKTKYST